MLASGRIKRTDALSMAYICQLLLQSFKGFKHEALLTTYEKIWERDLLSVLNARTPLQAFAFPPAIEEEEEAPQAPAPPPTPPPDAPKSNREKISAPVHQNSAHGQSETEELQDQQPAEETQADEPEYAAPEQPEKVQT
jgi:hypothetical protein